VMIWMPDAAADLAARLFLSRPPDFSTRKSGNVKLFLCLIKHHRYNFTIPKHDNQ
jgi:hypothetical protein